MPNETMPEIGNHGEARRGAAAPGQPSAGPRRCRPCGGRAGPRPRTWGGRGSRAAARTELRVSRWIPLRTATTGVHERDPLAPVRRAPWIVWRRGCRLRGVRADRPACATVFLDNETSRLVVSAAFCPPWVTRFRNITLSGWAVGTALARPRARFDIDRRSCGGQQGPPPWLPIRTTTQTTSL